MEICGFVLLAAGAVSTAARAGWLGPRAVVAVAAAWAALPWLADDLVARRSAAGLFAWAAAPDRVGAVATLVVAEALVGGWIALRLAGSGRIDDGARPRLTRLTTIAVALAPSPGLAVGLILAQASLYHRASGWSFSAVDAGLSAATFAVIAAPALAARLVLPDPARRAARAVPLFAALFFLGAALPPLLDSRTRGGRHVEVDYRATASVAALAAAAAGCGAAARLARSRRAGRGGEGEEIP
ncbi:MAG: hypothetical protein BGO49_11455 [Planctomycetales bacterium 71-10]|nr:MAG: hypothetical protein BGO49_11455 [Planctomycetales bacterium 71-10]